MGEEWATYFPSWGQEGVGQVAQGGGGAVTMRWVGQ